MTARSLLLPSPDATETLARALAEHLAPGSVILLTGDLGTGKSHFARALIRSLLLAPEDIPSPTFTLVQTYDTRSGPLWHADLYRLTGPDEVVELGLTEAFETEIAIVEWPDRLEDMAPANALAVTLAHGAEEETRHATLAWSDPRWDSAVKSAVDAVETTVMQGFLDAAGWSDASQTPLAGDASARRYLRLSRSGETAILMLDPTGDTPRFARLARHLNGLGLSAPSILAEAPGLLLLEDLGDGLIAKLSVDADSEKRLYLTATEALVALHAHPAPAGLPVATPAYLAQAIDLAFTHYARRPDLLPEAVAIFEPILARYAPPEDIMLLRDYHAENILMLPGRAGAARAGLLDFQDALNGHSAYDLVSLCRDVRRDIHAETEEACIRAYLSATGDDEESFRAAYAVLGVQRNLRILGVFARLAAGGKPRYLDFLPRTWAHLQDQLTHPALAPLRPIIDALTAPTPEHIESLKP